MTRQRDKRRPHVIRGRWTAEVYGAARAVVPTVKLVCGDRWSWDGSSHCLRVPIEYAADLEAAFEPPRSRTHPRATLW